MEEPMTTARGTADAEALGVRPRTMAAVLGTASNDEGPANAEPSPAKNRRNPGHSQFQRGSGGVSPR